MPAILLQPPPTEASRPDRSARSSSNRGSGSSAPVYGYHNTFHTHTQLPLDSPPPSYTSANSDSTLNRLNAQAQNEAAALSSSLPPYTCTVQIEGILGLKQELVSPFQVAGNREWNDVYVVLQGTQLSFYRIKAPSLLSKTRTVGPGRLIKTYSLQHAEVGIALDFKKTGLVPKSPFAHLVPSNARQKLYESEPQLFEPVREHVMRLRVETEQILLCCPTQEELLDWTEALCAAVDISTPIEDRSEPRYRSLPRRSRRQRMLDGGRFAENVENLNSVEMGRRLIAEQERIFRQLYPHLANPSTEHGDQGRDAPGSDHHASGDPEADDLDPADAHFPTFDRPSSSGVEIRPSLSRSVSNRPATSSDPKSAPPLRHTPAQALRFRRRCAPILLASSPRVSDVVFSHGKRFRINVKEHVLVDYTPHPPRYDAHAFPKDSKPLLAVPEETPVSLAVSAKTNTLTGNLRRPASPLRGLTDDSIVSSLDGFGYDLASASSAEPYGRLRLDGDSDESRSLQINSEPPSPTAMTMGDSLHPKSAARPKLEKTRTSEDQTTDTGFHAVALGVGLLI